MNYVVVKAPPRHRKNRPFSRARSESVSGFAFSSPWQQSCDGWSPWRIPSNPVPADVALDAVFSSHAALTLAHIVPALIFVLLTPLIYLRRFAGRAWVETLLFPLGAIIGLTAYLMSGNPVGGWIERSAVLFFKHSFCFACFAPGN